MMMVMTSDHYADVRSPLLLRRPVTVVEEEEIQDVSEEASLQL